MSETSDTPYRTSDLYFAAFLKTAGVPFLGVSDDQGKTFFLFEDQGPAMRDLKSQFFMDTAKIPPLSYAQAIRAMKALIFRRPKQ